MLLDPLEQSLRDLEGHRPRLSAFLCHGVSSVLFHRVVFRQQHGDVLAVGHPRLVAFFADFRVQLLLDHSAEVLFCHTFRSFLPAGEAKYTRKASGKLSTISNKEGGPKRSISNNGRSHLAKPKSRQYIFTGWRKYTGGLVTSA